MDEGKLNMGPMTDEERNAVLEEAEEAMLGEFADMSSAYLFTSGFDYRIIAARDAIRALKRPSRAAVPHKET